jgi:hypothetical protein
VIKRYYGPDVIREYKKIEDYKSSEYDLYDWVTQTASKPSKDFGKKRETYGASQGDN